MVVECPRNRGDQSRGQSDVVFLSANRCLLTAAKMSGGTLLHAFLPLNKPQALCRPSRCTASLYSMATGIVKQAGRPAVRHQRPTKSQYTCTQIRRYIDTFSATYYSGWFLLDGVVHSKPQDDLSLGLHVANHSWGHGEPREVTV